MRKRILSWLMVLCLALSLMPLSVVAADTPPAGYEDYTVIRDYFDLYDMALDMSGKYVLVEDIDLTDALAQGGDLYNSQGWIALGYSADASKCIDFTGVFDGNGHSIKGLNSNGVGAGLFWSNKGTIKNLTIASGEIKGTGTAAGAIAVSNAGVINNCHNYAAVRIGVNMNNNIFAGGITARNESSGVVTACSNFGTIYANLLILSSSFFKIVLPTTHNKPSIWRPENE